MVKLALSRLRLAEETRPSHVSVVFAVYKEHIRLRRASEHPLGEDALREKLRQLRWLFDDTPHTWDLTVVDDGCPESSGAIARAILDESLLPSEEARVYWLRDGIEAGHPIARKLESTADSQKGGSIRYGLWRAAQLDRGPRHVLTFTDADLSTHLGQLGMLVSPVLAGRAEAAIGSRREATSVVVKSGKRDNRGKLFIYLWKRMLPELHGVTDTQCGFKGFSADHLRKWIEKTEDSTFSFDIEALRLVRLTGDGRIERVPVAWIDSEAASTTAELSPYLSMLRNVARLLRSGGPVQDVRASYADLIESLDDEAFTTLLAHIPAEIADREPAEFDRFDGISAEQLADIAGLKI